MTIDQPVERTGPWSPAAQAIQEAKDASALDEWGDEGRGYDLEYMAQQLREAGWYWTGDEGPAAPEREYLPVAPDEWPTRSTAERMLIRGAAIYPLDVTHICQRKTHWPYPTSSLTLEQAMQAAEQTVEEQP